jgi:hypothetical protein
LRGHKLQSHELQSLRVIARRNRMPTPEA